MKVVCVHFKITCVRLRNFQECNDDLFDNHIQCTCKAELIFVKLYVTSDGQSSIHLCMNIGHSRMCRQKCLFCVLTILRHLCTNFTKHEFNQHEITLIIPFDYLFRQFFLQSPFSHRPQMTALAWHATESRHGTASRLPKQPYQ